MCIQSRFPGNGQAAFYLRMNFDIFTQQTTVMTKDEANDFIALHYPTYFNKLVYFDAEKLTARVKGIEALEGDGGEFTATCFLEDPAENEADFQDHIFSHLSLEDVIRLGRLV